MIKIKESQGAFNSTNYKAVREGSEDFTGYYITIEEQDKEAKEYDDLLDDYNELVDEYEAIQKELDEKKNDIEQYKKILARYQKENDELKEKYNQEVKNNKDFKRIMTERANARRGIKPKKKHPGYIVISQKQIHLDKKRNGWLSVIQTPIEVSMNVKYVMETVENEFNLADVEKIEYKQNYISGFWEFHIYAERHSNFSEDMRIKTA